MQTLTPWATGGPPRVGWFNASTERNADARRYWNGTAWSAPACVGDPDGHADRARNMPSDASSDAIEWRGLSLETATDGALDRYSAALWRDVDKHEAEGKGKPATIASACGSLMRAKQMHTLLMVRRQRLIEQHIA